MTTRITDKQALFATAAPCVAECGFGVTDAVAGGDLRAAHFAQARPQH